MQSPNWPPRSQGVLGQNPEDCHAGWINALARLPSRRALSAATLKAPEQIWRVSMWSARVANIMSTERMAIASCPSTG